MHKYIYTNIFYKYFTRKNISTPGTVSNITTLHINCLQNSAIKKYFDLVSFISYSPQKISSHNCPFQVLHKFAWL